MRIDRRKFARLTEAGVVTAKLYCVTKAGTTQHGEISGKLINVSQAGACLQIDDEIPEQESVELRLSLSAAGQTFALRCNVKWRRPVPSLHVHFLGVDFSATDPSTRTALEQLLGSLPGSGPQ
jgi:c-di-GMP-binding flagellar brake protein YcgR